MGPNTSRVLRTISASVPCRTFPFFFLFAHWVPNKRLTHLHWESNRALAAQAQIIQSAANHPAATIISEDSRNAPIGLDDLALRRCSQRFSITPNTVGPA